MIDDILTSLCILGAGFSLGWFTALYLAALLEKKPGRDNDQTEKP